MVTAKEEISCCCSGAAPELLGLRDVKRQELQTKRKRAQEEFTGRERIGGTVPELLGLGEIYGQKKERKTETGERSYTED